ncbi:MAG: LysR family transcriptional regulator, partial [Mycetocola sp.]
MLDIRKLNMLAELDRLGTIAAVAKSLNLTAPGISMQLSTLEREIGVALTERQGRRVVVTPAGQLLAR